MEILKRTIISLQAAGRRLNALRNVSAWSVWINMVLAVMLLTISIPTATSAAVYSQQTTQNNNAEDEDADDDGEGTFITHATGVIEVKLEDSYAETLETYAKNGYEWVQDIEVPIDHTNIVRFPRL